MKNLVVAITATKEYPGYRHKCMYACMFCMDIRLYECNACICGIQSNTFAVVIVVADDVLLLICMNNNIAVALRQLEALTNKHTPIHTFTTFARSCHTNITHGLKSTQV